MAASPRSSVNIHRSDTSKRPYLSIDPLEYSLTEGTNIPAPPRQPSTPPESPVSPIQEHYEKEKEKPQTGLTAQTAATSNGPLSSHPVTPIEAPTGSERGGFPFHQQESSSTKVVTNNASLQSARVGSSHSQGTRVATPVGTPARVLTPSSSSPLSQHKHRGFRQSGQVMTPPGSTEFHPQFSTQASQGHDSTLEKRTRRPSFAERFLRLRSLSSLRGRHSSRGSFPTEHLHNDSQNFLGSSTYASAEAIGHSQTMPTRGVKRPGSPSIAGLFRSTEQPSTVNGNAEGSQRASQSFPRMVRKKSMELLGTARRKSGMWTGRDTMNTMMAEEYERERMREAETEDTTEGGRDSTTVDDHESKVSLERRESLKEPPPTLPEIQQFKDMESESMFATIGKEE